MQRIGGVAQPHESAVVDMDGDLYHRPIMRSTDPDIMLLAALADPVRLSIVRQLAENDGICACDFTECCAVSQPTISHHLKVLREAGVLVSERQGTNIVYSLAPDLSNRWTGLGASLAGLVGVT